MGVVCTSLHRVRTPCMPVHPFSSTSSAGSCILQPARRVVLPPNCSTARVAEAVYTTWWSIRAWAPCAILCAVLVQLRAPCIWVAQESWHAEKLRSCCTGCTCITMPFTPPSSIPIMCTAAATTTIIAAATTGLSTACSHHWQLCRGCWGHNILGSALVALFLCCRKLRL